MIVSKKRVNAARILVDQCNCNIIISDDNKYPPISINLDVLPIVGEVLWKSSSYKDKFQDNRNETSDESLETKNLFLDASYLYPIPAYCFLKLLL